MSFLVDECVGPSVANWLLNQNHQVFSIYDEARGMDDDSIIQKADMEDWILITCDKQFGEMIHRFQHSHRGVILFRLEDERANIKIETLEKLLKSYLNRLHDQFVVVSETKIRIIKGKPKFGDSTESQKKS
ncbi:MAG: DUF5615 family PIN-like protein [Bacteroidota bacterium]|nr:DUF5615 family PIN-like protein [Bacteroidota bacterium]